MADDAGFDDAPEVEEIAKKLILAQHKHLHDYSVRMRYLFAFKTPKRKGKEVWGTCAKVSGRNAYLAHGDTEPFFVITISKPVWEVLPNDKREALVDSKLCEAWAEAKVKKPKKGHDGETDIEQDTPVKLALRPPDMEEFSSVVERHGMWRADVKEFVDAAMKGKDK